ncbi:MAG: hypothetical protein D9C04_04195 [Nitrosopumilus sp. B06]|nr:MAG: hypothetical protein D9C04_04195 [Nitrosopumilus sp. B06]
MEEMGYKPLGSHARKIKDLVDGGRYRTEDEFVRMAIEILLDWESDHPEECMDRMKAMRPFTREQERFMEKTMNAEERKKQFGEFESDRLKSENIIQEKLAERDDNYLLLQKNLNKTEEYFRKMTITRPQNEIPYNGYPRLSSFYSRFLPVKIVISVLAYRLAEDKTTRIELNEIRARAYDIAEELAGVLTKTEAENNIPRNKKMSTGLPKKGMVENDKEKMATAQKRFKDQFVGKVRKSRTTKKNHFDSALSALGLVYVFEDDGRMFITLTELGQKFAMLKNPVISGDYKNGPFTKEESEFILKELIPKLELEKKFVDAVVDVIRDLEKNNISGTSESDHEKISPMLNDAIVNAMKDYEKGASEIMTTYDIRLDLKNDESGRKLNQWRLATMGRLAELGVVDWEINEKGDSVYSLRSR